MLQLIPDTPPSTVLVISGRPYSISWSSSGWYLYTVFSLSISATRTSLYAKLTDGIFTIFPYFDEQGMTRENHI